MTAMTDTTRRIGRAEWTKVRTLPSAWRIGGLTGSYAEYARARADKLARDD
jgi:hypothetical protein